VVVVRLYGQERIPRRKKVLKAKNYIRRSLCAECREKYVDEWTNDIVPLTAVLCKRCAADVVQRVNVAHEHATAPWMTRLMAYMKGKRQAVQFALEFKFNRPVIEVFSDWYLGERLSAIEVHERLLSEYGFSISSRDISRWFCELGIGRTHTEAMRNRVVTGRMEYANPSRFSNRGPKRTALNPPGVAAARNPQGRDSDSERTHKEGKHVCLTVPRSIKGMIRSVARKKQQTISEVTRDMLDIYRRSGPDPNAVAWRKLEYVLDHHRDSLLRRKPKPNRGVPISLSVRPGS